MSPSLIEEKKLWKKGYKRVVGLDEAGRGSLAGPVVAVAIAINSKFKYRNLKPRRKASLLRGRQIQNSNFLNSKHVSDFGFRISDLKLRDSKKLTQKTRGKFYKILTNHSEIQWGFGKVSEKVIDKINIKNAAELAMEKALKNLEKKIKKKSDFLIIDGNHIKNLQLKTCNLKLIVRADEKVFSCAAASILAKVWRDRIMKRYHQKYPQYHFDIHKGYPTKLHLQLLKKYSPCEIYRKSFSPVKACIKK